MLTRFAETWGALNENLANFRMNVAGMLGGLDLMTRHASALGIEYAAAVRMRADVSGLRMSRFMGNANGKNNIFLSETGWENIRQRAIAAANSAAETRFQEVVSCGWARVKPVSYTHLTLPTIPLV